MEIRPSNENTPIHSPQLNIPAYLFALSNGRISIRPYAKPGLKKMLTFDTVVFEVVRKFMQ
ncbi:MAG: hypothetical protein JKX84_08155 [Flavobacteriales bacterium]|nr:hypothetical protein [Flavobacteriales bacterium]